MTTLATIALHASKALDDATNTHWGSALTHDWIMQAIRDYSVHFARTDTTTIAGATGDHDYDLPDDFLDMVACEYPDGQDPKEYLTRRSRLHPDFWTTPGYYDVQHWDALAANVPTLFISDEVTTGETIRITYTAQFEENITLTADPIDIPGHHEHLLILFVVWKACQHRLGTELQGPDTTTQLISQLKAAAWETREAYQQAMRDAEKRHVLSGFTSPWKSDEFDRIY